MAQLARLAGLSVSQLDRRFKRLFQMTPREFVLRVRLNAACRMLASTEDSITDIALRTGFYDQSHFTKHFRRQIGVTPRSYRGKYGAPSRRSAELARCVRRSPSASSIPSSLRFGWLPVQAKGDRLQKPRAQPTAISRRIHTCVIAMITKRPRNPASLLLTFRSHT